MADYALVVKHTNRQKSIGLRVRPGEVELSCPRWTTQPLIDQVLRDRAQWIKRQLAECASLPVAQKPQPIDGATWLFRGQPHVLRIHIGPRSIEFESGSIHVTLPEHQQTAAHVTRQIEQLFKAKALSQFKERSAYFAKQMSLGTPEIRVRRYRSRWGSCSARGVVTYHWPIIQAPDWVSDYLIVHELSHLVHFDHSPAFWAQVESVLPNWRDARFWLKEQGAPLLLP